ncbi:transcription factor E2F6 isoform X2 [Maylandia zebra]|uniref:transcription factor E2F6 isoform X2 n=1 Tax=Maylandia zebra TaxID=106582 RepID=UPI000D2F8388|nr:transcription factor E2F6 isoform X2 [Maylandia zebra]
MVKCVVSGCPNRVAHYTRGAFQPPPKRFFSFPKDPTRVQGPGWDWDDNISASLQQSIKRGKPLGSLTRGFLELLLAAPDGSLDIRQVAANLQTSVQQVHAIARVLDGISLIQRESAHKIKWIGWSSISSFLWRNQQKFHREIQKLKLVEEALDGFIRSCAQQLFSLTDNVENSSLAYVTFEDISRLGVYRDQTAIIVKAPEDTKLDVPAPTEESVQLWLKAVKGPILVMTCEVGSDNAVTSDPMQRITSFLTLNESRIRTTELHERSLTDLESP